MKLPENVVPMPAEQRAKLRELAEFATPGPWVADEQATDLVRCAWGLPVAVVSENREVHKGNLAYRAKNAAYIAAASPDVALATLAYVEALETHVGKLFGRAADLQTVINKAVDEYQALAVRLEAATARATKAESQAEGLQAELADQQAIAEAWKMVSAGHMKTRQAAIALLMQFPEYQEASNFLADSAPTPLPSSPAAAGSEVASEFFLNGDPSINPFGPR